MLAALSKLTLTMLLLLFNKQSHSPPLKYPARVFSLKNLAEPMTRPPQPQLSWPKIMNLAPPPCLTPLTNSPSHVVVVPVVVATAAEVAVADGEVEIERPRLRNNNRTNHNDASQQQQGPAQQTWTSPLQTHNSGMPSKPSSNAVGPHCPTITPRKPSSRIVQLVILLPSPVILLHQSSMPTLQVQQVMGHP